MSEHGPEGRCGCAALGDRDAPRRSQRPGARQGHDRDERGASADHSDRDDALSGLRRRGDREGWGDREAPRDLLEGHDDAASDGVRPEHVQVLRLGHGANCSSVGSIIDTLFVGAAVGSAIFAAVCAAMRDEPIRVVGAAIDDRDGTHPEDTEPPAPAAPPPSEPQEKGSR